MKTFASALIGLSLMIGTVMAQTPAASTSNSTDTTKSTKVHKHKKHAPAASTTPAQSTAATPAAK